MGMGKSSSTSMEQSVARVLGVSRSNVSIQPIFEGGQFTGRHMITVDTMGQTSPRNEVLRQNIINSLEQLTGEAVPSHSVTVHNLTIARYSVSITVNDCKVGILDHDKYRIGKQFQQVLAYGGYNGHVVESVKVEDLRSESDNTVRYEFSVRYRW